MYHRILPKTDRRFAAEEPGMVVTPETFDRHLRELKTLFTIMPLSEWIERRKAGKALPQRACAITFDDGWLDNYEYALPVLHRQQTPATIFAVSHMIGTRLAFWPNRLARLLQLDNRHGYLEWLRECSQYHDAGRLDKNAISSVIGFCKRFSDVDLQHRLDQAEAQLQLPVMEAQSLMNWEQLRQAQASGVVEVGSHTCHHFRLTESLDAKVMADEITSSKQLLEQQLERPVSLFCYPNGDTSALATRLVGEMYGAAVTTRRGINAATADVHLLSRIGVHEDVSDTPTLFKARLSGWV